MKEEGPSEGLMAAAREILSYLVEHPEAKDTAEGIMKWWLSKGSTEREKDEVQDAIDFLVAKGWLAMREIADSKKIYGVERERLEEIKEFLNCEGNG
ncbi:MAG TPA: hypothetical protein VI584_04005 [Nitrospiria bacterium]|nr:hypothetical protein [Nitrospiria bacterium]